jgi:hypothetical protein
MISQLIAWSDLASPLIPALSETLSKARRIGTSVIWIDER